MHALKFTALRQAHLRFEFTIACAQGTLTIFGVLTAAVDIQIQQYSTEFSLQFGEDKAHPVLGKQVRDTVVSGLTTSKEAAIKGINLDYRQVTKRVTFLSRRHSSEAAAGWHAFQH